MKPWNNFPQNDAPSIVLRFPVLGVPVRRDHARERLHLKGSPRGDFLLFAVYDSVRARPAHVLMQQLECLADVYFVHLIRPEILVVKALRLESIFYLVNIY